jgi:hypothetical protein
METKPNDNKMVTIKIKVPENWKAFLIDVAKRHKEEPAALWGQVLTESVQSGIECDSHYLLFNMPEELVEKYGLGFKVAGYV